jgi:hypothetical protein
MKKLAQENKNIPLFSVHLTLDGEERHFTYLESRFFYCKAYEVLTRDKSDLRVLREKLKSGINLMICGYDAYALEEDKELYVYYCDTTRPFGHELVLYSLLVVEDPMDYPWQRYMRDHPEIYDNIACVL